VVVEVLEVPQVGRGTGDVEGQRQPGHFCETLSS
jgi:hypothetical protein